MRQGTLDDIDIHILEALQREGRESLQALANEVGLSLPAVRERLKRLFDTGFIRGIHALLDSRKLGLDITAFVMVNSSTSLSYDALIEHVKNRPAIQECHSITGKGSHILKIKVRTTKELEVLLSEIQAWPGVINTETSVVLSTYKETPEIPLSHLPNNS